MTSSHVSYKATLGIQNEGLCFGGQCGSQKRSRVLSILQCLTDLSSHVLSILYEAEVVRRRCDAERIPGPSFFLRILETELRCFRVLLTIPRVPPPEALCHTYSVS